MSLEDRFKNTSMGQNAPSEHDAPAEHDAPVEHEPPAEQGAPAEHDAPAGQDAASEQDAPATDEPVDLRARLSLAGSGSLSVDERSDVDSLEQLEATRRAERSGEGDPYAELKTKVQRACIARLGPQLFAAKEVADLRDRVIRLVSEELKNDSTPLAHGEREQLIHEIANDIIGYGADRAASP